MQKKNENETQTDATADQWFAGIMKRDTFSLALVTPPKANGEPKMDITLPPYLTQNTSDQEVANNTNFGKRKTFWKELRDFLKKNEETSKEYGAAGTERSVTQGAITYEKDLWIQEGSRHPRQLTNPSNAATDYNKYETVTPLSNENTTEQPVNVQVRTAISRK